MAYISLAKPLLSLFLLSCIAQALVPLNKTFEFVNQGELGPNVVEYGASYRVIDLFTSPFQLCFYNATPNDFTLALGVGVQQPKSIVRWVWMANCDFPAHDNATFSFEQDGNLVLKDPDGLVTWQSSTANQGVVGFKLLPNGNMVLYDSKGKFIWQSFEGKFQAGATRRNQLHRGVI